MSTPRLRIRVNGELITPGSSTNTLADHLYAVYFQSTAGVIRNQWVVFPPPVEELLPKYSASRDRQITFARTQSFPGNRSRWSKGFAQTPDGFAALLESEAKSNRTLEKILVVPLGLDALEEAYDPSSSSPSKAFRAVDTLLTSVHGISIK